MPARVHHENGKWRVVHTTDTGIRLVTNTKGTPVDGGGHASEEAAIAQARAINARRERKK